MSDDTTDGAGAANSTPDAAAETAAAEANTGATTQYDAAQAPSYRPEASDGDAPAIDFGDAPAIDFGDASGGSAEAAAADVPAVDVAASPDSAAGPTIEQPDAADHGFGSSAPFGQATDPAENGAPASQPDYGQAPSYGAPPSQPVPGQAAAYGAPAPQPDYGQAPAYGQAPQADYGQAPTYGQAPQADYGQAPAYGAPQPDYGQAPTYGQAPQADYGQPPAYGAPQAGYGQQPMPPAYGQQAPGAYPAYGYAQPPVTGTKYWALTFLMYIPYVGWLVALIVAFVQRSSAQKTGQPLAIGNANAALNFMLTYLPTQLVLIIAMVVIGSTTAAANPYDDDPSPLIALPAFLILVVGIWALVMMIMGCVKSSRTVFTAVPSIPFVRN